VLTSGGIDGVDQPATGLWVPGPGRMGFDQSRVTQLWRVELAPGYSGPIVVGDAVFVTETRD